MFTQQQREDLLVTALEGGSNYWCVFKDLRHKLSIHVPLTETEPTSIRVFKAVNLDAEINVWDAEDPSELLGVISFEAMKKGEKLMADNSPKHFNDVMSESWDAETADVWFQYVVMGEIVFG